MARKLDLAQVPAESGGGYPAPFDQPCRDQASQRLARYAGLDQFGVNLTTLGPGAWSSQRHWHSEEDEFVWVVEGEVLLVSEAGEEVLRAGDCVAFRHGDPDGHHLINRSAHPARILEIGTRKAGDRCTYSDIDMVLDRGDKDFRHRDGRAYPRSD